MSDSAAKLQQLIQVSIDNAMVGVKDHVTARVQDLQIQVGQLEVQLRTLNAAIADGAATKAKPRTKKAAADAPTTPTDVTPDDVAAAAAEAVAPASTDDKKFASNSYNWFTQKFKTDPEFRAKHLTPANLELMKTDEIIAKKKTDAEKITPQAKYLWTYYKAKDAAMNKQLNAQYEAEKEAYEKKTKPAQQAKEADSPTTAHK